MRKRRYMRLPRPYPAWSSPEAAGAISARSAPEAAGAMSRLARS